MAQIRERLSRRFELLRGGRRDASTRQATLRSTIDWSWKLLNPAEQAALAQCSIFRGGFTVEAAEAVLVLPGEDADVLEVLQSLRAKSLLRARPPDGLARELRLDMFESIREYAAARRVELGGGEAPAARHAEYYLGLAASLKATLRTRDGVLAYQQLSRERDNLLVICDEALGLVPATPASVTRALAALIALEPEVLARGPLGSMLARLDTALGQADTLPIAPMMKAEAVAARGRLRLEAGLLGNARQDLEKACAAFQQFGLLAQEKRAWIDLAALTAIHQGDPAAWRFIQEAQRLPVSGDRWLDAYTVGNTGVVAYYLSGANAAISHFREALERFRAEGDLLFELHFLNNSANAIGEGGDAAESISPLEEALDKVTLLGDHNMWVNILTNLGCYLLEAGRPTEARERLEAALSASRRLGIQRLEAGISGELGRAYMALGKITAAHECLKEATSTYPWHSLRFSSHLAATQAELGQLAAAREGFVALETDPAVQGNPTLRELTALLRAWLDLAEARALPGGSADALQLLEQARQRVEHARSVPAEAISSDLRLMLRILEQRMQAQGL